MQREQTRLQVTNGVLLHQIGEREAGKVVGLSERHLWRILAAYREEGAAALTHGTRAGQPVVLTYLQMVTQ